MEVVDGHKERMNFFAWTINYALIPAPTAASLDDASSILTFALLPLLLPLPLHPPSSSPPRHPPPRDRIRPRTTKERPVHACTGREILNRVRARTSSSFPFSITIYTRIYIYIYGCPSQLVVLLFTEKPRDIYAREIVWRGETGLVEKKRRKRKNGRRAKKATNRRVVVERRRREEKRERWRGKGEGEREREGSRG